jgi:acyl-CoA dehydrogenase
MADRTYLSWPFFDEAHRELAAAAAAWRERELDARHDADPAKRCRA